MSPLRKLSPLSQRVVGVIILVLTLMTVGSTAYYTHEQREIERCQAQFNDRFIQQINERNKIGNSDRESLAKLVEQMLTLPKKEDRRKALQDYLKQKDKNDEERKKHPLPELPEKSAHC